MDKREKCVAREQGYQDHMNKREKWVAQEQGYQTTWIRGKSA